MVFEKGAGVSESSVRSITSPSPTGFRSGAVALDSSVRSKNSMAFLLPLDGVVFAKDETLSAFD